MGILRTTLAALLCLPTLASPNWIKVDPSGAGFVFVQSAAMFTPWGYNYLRDENYRLLEDYWNDGGPHGREKVERDFREMKRLGANVVRLHLLPPGSSMLRANRTSRISLGFRKGSTSQRVWVFTSTSPD